MTSSGSIAPRRRCSRSLLGASRPSRSAWSSRLARRAMSWRDCRSSWSRVCGRTMRARCWNRCSQGPWTRGSGTRSSPRRAATRWRCWSCRGGWRPPSWRAGSGSPRAVPLSGRIEASFRRRLDRLPAETRRLLQVAAADPVGDPALVWRAAERLAIGTDAATPAVEAGLIEFDARVRFRHPLVRSAAYQSASLQERHDAHRALAEVTDPKVDPDRRAWHRAQATPGPTRTSPRSSSARPAARRRAGAWPRRPHSSSARRR